MRSYIIESVNRNYKRTWYSSKVLGFKKNAKKTWGIMKELMAKIRNTELIWPKELVTEKKKKNETKDMAEEFKTFLQILRQI